MAGRIEGRVNLVKHISGSPFRLSLAASFFSPFASHLTPTVSHPFYSTATSTTLLDGTRVLIVKAASVATLTDTAAAVE